MPQPSCAIVGNLDAFDQVYDYNYAATGIEEPFVRNERDRFEFEGILDLDSGHSLQLMGFQSDEYYERATDANLTNDANGFERDPTDIEEKYAELRLTSSGDERFRYGLGVSVYDYEFLTIVYRNAGNFNSGTGGRRISETATNIGGFFNLTYDLTDQLTASFEGRYQSDDVSGIAGDGFTVSQTTKTFLPRVSITYSPSDTTTFYAQYAEGNNPAGVNIGGVDPAVVAASNAFPGIFDAQTITFFEEEEVKSFEIGVKGTVGNKLSYAVNAYMLDWQNYTQAFNLNFEPNDFIDVDDDGLGDVGTQYAGLDFGPGRSFLGAGDVTGKGLEVEGNYFMTDKFKIGLAASYIDITYDDNACSTNPLNFGVPANAMTSIGLACRSVAGNELGTQPKLSGTVNFSYNDELTNGMGWFARWNTRFTSSQYITEMNLGEIDSYTVTDFRVGLNTDAWRAELYVNNLFDDDTPQGPQTFFDGRIPGPPPFATNAAYTDRRGRAFGVRLNYNFQ